MTMWENQVEKEHHGKPVPEGFIYGEGALPEAPITPPSIVLDIPSDLPAAGHVEFLRKRRMLAKVLQQLQASGLPGQEQADPGAPRRRLDVPPDWLCAAHPLPHRHLSQHSRG